MDVIALLIRLILTFERSTPIGFVREDFSNASYNYVASEDTNHTTLATSLAHEDATPANVSSSSCASPCRLLVHVITPSVCHACFILLSQSREA